jgi:hypothetical protein
MFELRVIAEKEKKELLPTLKSEFTLFNLKSQRDYFNLMEHPRASKRN